MEANALIEKLKANGTASDFYDLQSIQADFMLIYKKISSKDRATFALNVLCMICRNLEKIPKWSDNIDNKQLLDLSVLCFGNYKLCKKEHKVKLLACHYHLHKYLITQKLPSELILQFSHMPFEEDCLSDYAKTYWAIMVDRLTYIESYKRLNANIGKILPQLTSDLIKIITMYNVGHFCQDIANVLVKKLFYLYGEDYSNQLSDCFIQLFGAITESELQMKDGEYYAAFRRVSECCTVLIENGLRTQKIDMNFVKGIFLKLFANKTDIIEVVNVYYFDVFDCNNLNKIFKRLDGAENKIDLLLLPHYSNVLRLNLEHAAQSDPQKWRELMPINLQIVLVKVVFILMKKLKKCEQISKCERCIFKTALHDSLRLGFASKVLIMNSIKYGMDVEAVLLLNYAQIELENVIIRKLKENKCTNVEKYLFKNQSNVHNLAILLYQNKYYEISRKLFDLYLINEFQGKIERKNIIRGLYNKAICEIDAKLYEEAIKSGYLSLIFSYPDMLNTEKYISLIMDVKSKSQNEDIMMTNVMRVCTEYDGCYGSLAGFFSNVDFCKLLQYEFDMYSKLWPSTQPIYSIISTYYDVFMKKYDYVNENEDVILQTLCRNVLKSLDIIRNLHCVGIKNIILQIINILKLKLDNKLYKMVYATLLFLKTEYGFIEASERFDWKILEKNQDLEHVIINRTMSQEFDVMNLCLESIEMWIEISLCVKDATLIDWLPLCLPVLEFAAHLLLHMGQVGHALQTSYVIVKLSAVIDNMELYIKYAGVLFYHTKIHSDVVMDLFRNVSANVQKYFEVVDKETLLLCLCDASIYLLAIGRKSVAVCLAAFVQDYLIENYNKNNTIYEMPTARLLEVFDGVFENSQVNRLSTASNIQKKWFAVTLNKTSWLSRRVKSLQLKYNCARATVRCADICRNVLLWRRARSSVFNAVSIVGASDMAELYCNITNIHKADDAQAKIENRLKYILYSTELKNNDNTDLFIEKNNIEINVNKVEAIETMLRAKNFTKNDKSPLSIVNVPAFKMAEFLLHKNNCLCYLCSDPNSLIISLKIVLLESSMYFRNNENEIARNYFEGALKMINFLTAKLDHHCQSLKRKNYEQFLIQTVRDVFAKKIIQLHIELLIEYSFFELALNNVLEADDSIVQIHELLEEYYSIKSNYYLIDSYMNLIVALNKIKERAPKTVITTLEQDFENLNLSPKSKELLRTPVNKVKEPRNTEKIRIKNVDEIPKLKLKIKKFDLDNTSPEKITKPLPKLKKENIQFKMPKTVKLLPEAMTPRAKPKLVLTHPSLDSEFSTPNKADFFTPIKNEETPIHEDKFFTPLTNVKTYSNKKTLRQQVVKNLEQDFIIYNDAKDKKSNVETESTKVKTESTKVKAESTKVKAESTKVKVESGTLKAIRDKRTLRRATSPGKLPTSEKSVATSKPAKKLVLSPDSKVRPNLRSKK